MLQSSVTAISYTAITISEAGGTMHTRETAEVRKSEIGKMALDIAFEFGPDRVTTGMIAEKLGLTQPAIYKHFPKKSDIWTDVAQFLSEQIIKNIATINKLALPPMSHIKALVLGRLEVIQENPALPEFMVTHNTSDVQTELRESIQLAMISFRSELEDAVKFAINQRVFRDNLNPAGAAMLIFGVIQSLVLRMMVTRNPAVLLVDGERLLNLQLAGFTIIGDNT